MFEIKISMCACNIGKCPERLKIIRESFKFECQTKFFLSLGFMYPVLFTVKCSNSLVNIRGHDRKPDKNCKFTSNICIFWDICFNL